MLDQKTRRLAAIMFTDIVGYTALMQRDEQAAAKVRALHRVVFEAQHHKHQGEILQYYGDGTLSIFQSGVEAVKCAIEIQTALSKTPAVPLRIGLHMGDIVFDGTEIYGDGVNLASRIESMSVAGAILLSGKLNDELKNQPQLSTKSLGHFELKNIGSPIELFAIKKEGLKIPKASELNGKGKRLSKSIAVLPFVNRSSDPENEYFSDGMTEEIINALSNIKGLKVTSRTSSFFFKNKQIPLSQVGQELNVSTILEGSIRLSGKKMRITAQLIDVKDDFHFWSETFDRSLNDVFVVQDEISLLIADRLREHLGHFEIADRLVEVPAIPVDIYTKYLQSRYYILKMTKPDIEKGLALLEEIISTNPNYPLAHLGIHLAYTLMGTIGLMPAKGAFAKGQQHLDKAVELEEDLPECQLQLSYITFLQHWDLKATYEHLNKARSLRETADFYPSMASTLVAEGKFAAASHYIGTALELDPLSNINYHIEGFIFYVQGQYEAAIASFDKSVQLNPHFTTSMLYRGQCLILMQEAEKALDYFKAMPGQESGDLIRLGGMTMAYAALGDQANYENGITKLEALLTSDLMERAHTFLIACYALRGMIESALQKIEEGINHRLPMMVYLRVDPILKELQMLPRFQELIQKIFRTTPGTNFVARKYKQTLFTKAELHDYRKRLKSLMIKEQPYLDPNLTLRGLAEMMDIPANQLSQLLNAGFDQNFAAFVNSYRLETFKAKAADPDQQHLTILALSFESGFNSKTVFNTFFKKEMGMTPRAYWKKVQPQ